MISVQKGAAMSLAPVNFRMETDLKEQFALTCHDMGMTISTAFTIFARTVVRQHAIPFPVSADPFYSEQNLDELRAAVARLDAGQGVEKTMADLEAMAQ
jgi:DNA-damage-inducible protein J